MKQLVPAFLITKPTASSRTMRMRWEAKNLSQSVIRLRVAAERTSRSICSDGAEVPNVVQTRSCLPVSATVIVEKGGVGLRRKIRARSAERGSPFGQILSRVMKRSAYGERRP